jgi:predicted enzyme related to lactoylglutathione lyase
MNRITRFEFGVTDIDRAADFYSKAFGWKIESWGGYPNFRVISTGDASEPGIDGSMMVHKDAGARTINVIDVADIEEALRKVTEAGGQVVVPRMVIPHVGYSAYFKDTEGMLIGVHQRDPLAKAG